MRSLQISIVVSVVAALLLPTIAFAEDGGPFFTTSDPDAAADADGTSVSTARGVDEDMELLQAACKDFFENQGGTAGTWVYWHNVSEGQWYRFELISNGSCSPASVPTAPPEDGVPVTPPLVTGGLLALGFLLISAAWLLRRRRLRSS